MHRFTCGYVGTHVTPLLCPPDGYCPTDWLLMGTDQQQRCVQQAAGQLSDFAGAPAICTALHADSTFHSPKSFGEVETLDYIFYDYISTFWINLSDAATEGVWLDGDGDYHAWGEDSLFD